MATKRLLVDAIHPEETRIVVTNGNRLEEFDFESATRRQLRGNIYLAKVTRVEPSLQAAFVEYGGNRHGFLAFSEIHPDYYQIPVADREALLREEEEAVAAEQAKADDEDDHEEDAASAAADAPAPESISEPAAEDDETAADEDGADAVEQDDAAPTEAAATDDPQSVVPVEAAETEPPAEGVSDTAEAAAEDHHDDHHDDDHSHIEQAPAETEPVENVGSGDALEEIRERRRPQVNRRNYKIQEVIKRRQVMLVQVVKEERGNKGAALTTYLSLAGRYSVLMPNTARGGGISRKITNAADRKRLKEIVGDLDIPAGQGIILRTAGASRTKAEVKRDFEYLQRLWENVRTLTLKSTAPCLVYEEGSLIKRTIRDLYSKDIEEMFVAGDDAYREAKDFMRMIMPSHAKNVQLYKDDHPIFSKYAVENQLDQMFSPQVTLPSGGYIVINPTEALVSIDVNSGRATKEHNIEDTALQTNLEAAEEIARQLRLRDLAGLIVIDFIDMIENRSNRAVERKLKDSLKNDRARIQVGRISHFGLMEMSRQRIRFGVVESSTHKCPVCAGTGIVRSTESIALMVMRAVEDHVLRKPGNSINVKVPTDVALYILNTKRHILNNLEAKYALSITVVADDHIPGAHYQIERGEPRIVHGSEQVTHVRVDSAAMTEPVADDVVEDEPEEEEEATEAREREDNGERRDGGRRGRRRRGGRGRDRERDSEPRQTVEAVSDAEGLDDDGEESAGGSEASPRADNGDNGERKRRRRGRRGGRRNRRPENGDYAPNGHAEAEGANAGDDASASVADGVPEAVTAAVLSQDAIAESNAIEPDISVAATEEKPKRGRRRKTETADGEPPARPRARGRGRKVEAPPPTAEEAVASAEALAEAASPPPAVSEPAAVAESEPPRRPKKELPPDEIVVSSTSAPANDEQPKKKGWWNRGFFGS